MTFQSDKLPIKNSPCLGLFTICGEAGISALAPLPRRSLVQGWRPAGPRQAVRRSSKFSPLGDSGSNLSRFQPVCIINNKRKI